MIEQHYATAPKSHIKRHSSPFAVGTGRIQIDASGTRQTCITTRVGFCPMTIGITQTPALKVSCDKDETEMPCNVCYFCFPPTCRYMTVRSKCPNGYEGSTTCSIRTGNSKEPRRNQAASLARVLMNGFAPQFKRQGRGATHRAIIRKSLHHDPPVITEKNATKHPACVGRRSFQKCQQHLPATTA